MITSLGHLNDGPSITNKIEYIIDSIIKNGYATQPATFIEHYEREFLDMDSFDKIEVNPGIKWEGMRLEEILELIRIGCRVCF